jgi:F-type H+-transporting ATPase subunit gamma
MAKSRALDKRRKSVKNIRKITRTMELIATARFKKAMDRASAATAYTKKITQLVADLAQAGLKVTHPLLEARPETKSATLLVLTANRGLCGGYNGNVVRQSLNRWEEFKSIPEHTIEISGKRGLNAFKFRGQPADVAYTHFEDKPTFAEVELLANRYLDAFLKGNLDRLDVAYMRFDGIAKQVPVVETLLPLGSIAGANTATAGSNTPADSSAGQSDYEFLPSAESILEEVVPTSFKIKLFKCFLDAAVSEQVARMTAMKAATENAGDLIKTLSTAYNRARQGQITGEIMEILGGVEALKNK